MKNIRLAFWWKEKWKQSPGIMLITTLLILAILVGMTVGFITINRDNLMLATNAKDQEAALQAAYAGVQYVQMRFEEDGNFGNDISSSTWTSPIAKSPTFVSYEGNGVAVGVLNNGMSVFEIIFDKGKKEYDLSAIAADPNSDPSESATFPTNEVSDNNFNSSGSGSPNGTARIVVLGYSHGVTRVAEAMLEQLNYVNASAEAGGNIDVSSSCSGNKWMISTKFPLVNDVKAGIKYVKGKSSSYFANRGGDVTGPSLSNIFFSDGTSDNGIIGEVDALQYAFSSGDQSQSNGGSLSLGGSSETSTVYTSNTNSENGALVPDSGNVGELPSKDLHGSDILQQTEKQQENPVTETLPSGIYAFDSDNGKGDKITVYNFEGSPTTTYTGNIPIGGVTVATISNYQLQIQPGVNLQVPGSFMLTLDPADTAFTSGTNYDTNLKQAVLPTLALDYSGTNQIGAPAPGGPGNPSTPPPSGPSTFDVSGGSVYIQGSVVGSGSLVVQQGSPPSSDPASGSSSWIPSSSSWNKSWAYNVGNNVSYSFTPQNGVEVTYDPSTYNSSPPSADDKGGDLYVDGQANTTAAPTESIGMYAGNNAKFNEIPYFTSNQINPVDGQAFETALNNLANCSSGSSSGSCGGWTSSLTLPGSGPASQLNSLNQYGQYQKPDITNLLQFAYYGSCSTCGLQNMQTIPLWQALGCSASNTCNLTTTQTTDLVNNAATLNQNNGGTSIITTTSCSGGDSLLQIIGLGFMSSEFLADSSCTPSSTINYSNTLNLYTYEQITQYISSGKSSWLSYSNCSNGGGCSGPLDPVEKAISSRLNFYYNQAIQSGQNFGSYMNTTTWTSSTSTTPNGQPMSFEGLLYVKGSGGFEAASGCAPLTIDGSLVTTEGEINIPDSSSVSFIYDPSQLSNYVGSSIKGVRTQILWMTVW